MSRSVTLVLIDGDGVLLGALPPYPVGVPYWQEVSELVTEAERLHGVPIQVLRLLNSERAVPHGGAVTYLAEVRHREDLLESSLGALAALSPEVSALAGKVEALRAPYAEVGGPAASLAWAASVVGPGYVSVQQRTWNLSAIWRLESAEATCWLKQVPAFFAHESAVLGWAGAAVPGAVPRLLAAGDQGRMLLEHVEGEDLYDAPMEVREEIVETALRIQWASVSAVDALVEAGVPDRRGAHLANWVRGALKDCAEAVGHPALALLNDLDHRMTAIAECGLPDALVHGDEHPGNAIGASDRTVILDWGDSFVGHPGFDALRLGVGLPDEEEASVASGWARRWQERVPGSDPLRAVALLRPVECLRLAAVYASFVANIEPTEWPYHSADITDWLDRAVEAATDDRG